VGGDFGQVYYKIGAGPWTLLSGLPQTTCGNAACTSTNAVCTATSRGVWSTFSTILPSACNNTPSFFLGFRWQNNGDNIGTNPSFAIDDIVLSAGISMGIDPLQIKQSQFNIYPNPSHDKLNVVTNSVQQIRLQLEIMDVLGRVSLRNNNLAFEPGIANTLDISELPKGIYFLKISSNSSEPEILKFIKE
jgi:hypothetical protein